MACRLFELYGNETNMKLLAKELAPLQGIGSQTCITFSVDGSKFAAGGLVRITLNSNQCFHFLWGALCFSFSEFGPVCLTSVLNKCRMDIWELWNGLTCAQYWMSQEHTNLSEIWILGTILLNNSIWTVLNDASNNKYRWFCFAIPLSCMQ